MPSVILDAIAGIVAEWPPCEGVIILGKGPSGSSIPRSLLRTSSIWAVNTPGPSWAIPYITRGWQIHDLAQCDRYELAWLREEKAIPIYTRRVYSWASSSVRYPIEAVRDRFGHDAPFTSSFDYMMGLACLERYESITLAGIEYQLGGSLRERMVEHVGLAWWTGLARGLGITVTIMGGALQFPYAYGTDIYREAEWARRQIREAILQGLRIDEGYNNPTALRRWQRRQTKKSSFPA